MALEKYYSTDIDGHDLPYNIDYTILVADESRKKLGSTVGRAAIGAAILGPVGLLAGATGKNKRTSTFVVKCKDGTTRNITVYTDSIAFSKLCEYLR